MRYYVSRQILSAIPVVLAVTLFVFLLTHMAPGDPASLLAPEDASDEDVERLRERMGLDQPIWTQYVGFLGRMARGDLGVSYYYGEPVLERIRSTLPATYELALLATVFAVIVAIPVGVMSAINRGTVIDNVAMSTALFGVSMPRFWFGILLIMLFSVALGWLPVSGRVSYGVEVSSAGGFYLFSSLLAGNLSGGKDVLLHLLLPAVTLSGSAAAAWSRLVRSAMLEVTRADFVRTARAKGLPERMVVWKHTFRNALIPVITMMGVQMRAMLGGSIVVETVFGYPGIGRLLITAINCRDYFLVLGVVMVYALTAIGLNLLVDISYALVDPRLKYS